MEKQIFKVENPVYLTKCEMSEKYQGKQVLITNIQDMPDHSEMHGGIVRYYANGAMKELWQLLAHLRETEGVDAIACCSIVYLGPIYSVVPIKSGVHYETRDDLEEESTINTIKLLLKQPKLNSLHLYIKDERKSGYKHK